MGLVEAIVGTAVDEEKDEIMRFLAGYRFQIVNSEILQNPFDEKISLARIYVVSGPDTEFHLLVKELDRTRYWLFTGTEKRIEQSIKKVR